MNLFKNNKYTLKIESSTVLYSLLNLRQLVFEVTSKCNLNCVYCGYGELYNKQRIETSKNLDFLTAKNLIDYLVPMWRESNGEYEKPIIVVSFYGGEPLLNFSLIEKIITYIDSISHEINKSIHYAMTTNAMFLDKYMDFLADKKFKLLISLDGNEFAHSYRVDNTGKNSFNRVIKNVELLRNTHPSYFEEYVDFNSVLTNRATFFSVKKFIFDKFGKYPFITDLNTNGVFPEKIDSFNSICRFCADDFNDSENTELSKSYLHESPTIRQTYALLRTLSENSYDSYDDLLSDKTTNKWLPTGTCLPFTRKLFLTADGNILPCERINHKYSIGKATADNIDIDFEKIANIYSDHYKRLWKSQCFHCASKIICQQCMFYVDNLDTSPKCPGYRNKKEYLSYIQSNINYIADNPEVYEKMMKEFY